MGAVYGAQTRFAQAGYADVAFALLEAVPLLQALGASSRSPDRQPELMVFEMGKRIGPTQHAQLLRGHARYNDLSDERLA